MTPLIALASEATLTGRMMLPPERCQGRRKLSRFRSRSSNANDLVGDVLMDVEPGGHVFPFLFVGQWVAWSLMQPWPSPRTGCASVSSPKSLATFLGDRDRLRGVGEPKPPRAALCRSTSCAYTSEVAQDFELLHGLLRQTSVWQQCESVLRSSEAWGRRSQCSSKLPAESPSVLVGEHDRQHARGGRGVGRIGRHELHLSDRSSRSSRSSGRRRRRRRRSRARRGGRCPR